MRVDRILLAAAVAMLCVAAVVALTKRTESAPAPSEPNPGEEATLSLLVVGVKGLDTTLLTEFSAAGLTPNMTRLMSEGAVATFENPWWEQDSRVSWTSLVTGVLPENQGIGGQIRRRGRMVPAPLTPEYRTAETIWTIVAEGGGRVGVVGWPATWPAEEVGGVMVSPYVQYMLARKHEGEASEGIFPPSEVEDIDSIFIDEARIRRLDLARFVKLDSWLGIEAIIGEGYASLQRAVAADMSMYGIATYVASDAGVDNLLVCLEGLEAVSFRFWHFMDPEPMRRAGAGPLGNKLFEGQMEALSVTIPQYYAFVDEIIGELERMVADGGTIAVVSASGFRELEIDAAGMPAMGTDRRTDRGLLILRGPRVSPGSRVEGLDLIGVAPTIMAAASIEPPQGIDGNAHAGLLAP
jgi:hypothetical protein